MMMNARLGKLYRTAEFENRAHLTGSAVELYLPTEVVVDTPQIVTPRVARLYKPDLFLVLEQGRLVDSDGMVTLEGKTWRGKTGSVWYREVYLWEVWLNNVGSGGRVDFCMVGYVYEPSNALCPPADKKYPVRFMDEAMGKQYWE